MGSFGWHNPWPFEWGGGTTSIERTYLAMRSAVGKGGSAEDDDGTVEGLWRQSRARGLGAVGTFGERVAVNNFPGLSTDLLPYYEKLLRIVASENETVEERRAEAQALWIRILDAATPIIEAELAAIDPLFTLLDVPNTSADTTQAGRAFEDFTASEPFGGTRKSTDFPNYSTDFIVFVQYAITPPPSAEQERRLTLARKFLNDALPSWVSFRIHVALGFTLDTDLLDLTGLLP